LLDICRGENEDVKNQYRQVMGAEREILDLMREELNGQPRFGNYARSKVEMFPGTSRGGMGQGYNGYPTEYRPRPSQPILSNGRGYPSRHQQYGRQPLREHYASDYIPSDPRIPTAGYEDTSGHFPGEHPMLNKSKVVELGSGGYQQLGSRRGDDGDVRHLQQEVGRLRNVVHDYENQIAMMRNQTGTGYKSNMLHELKDQG
jgi:hypothetical protein